MMKMIGIIRKKGFFHFLLVLSIFCSISSVQAAVLIWPTSLSINPGEKATALWLENRGQTDQIYQARVFSWSQENGKDALSEQERVVVSPPMMQIEPGKRQLIRLINLSPVAQNKEMSYRVIVDELPIDTGQAAPRESSGIQFQMRYSIPLFVYGPGLPHPMKEVDKKVTAEAQELKMLTWKIVRHKDSYHLAIHNNGPTHVYLSDIDFGGNRLSQSTHPKLAGYVLSGSTMEWPLPNNMKMTGSKTLTAVLYGKQPIIIPYAEK